MKKRKQKTNYQVYDEIESDDYFAYIVGYTSSGFPYGVTHEELEEMEADEEPLLDSKSAQKIADSDLPF